MQKEKTPRPPIPDRELVGSGPQQGIARGGTPEGTVDVGLEVLDADAHGKGLALQEDALASEQLKDVAGGVAAGEHDVAGGHAFLGRRPVLPGRLQGDGGDARRIGAGDLEVGQAATAAQLTAQVLDAAGDVRDRGGQHVAADMGMGVPEDLRVGACLHERLEDGAVRRAARAGGQLAVGKGAGAAEAVLDV